MCVMRMRRAALGAGALAMTAAALVAPPVAQADIQVTPRVVNGVKGPEKEFQALVAVGDKRQQRSRGMRTAQICGGTLTTPTLVITAAHCVAGRQASSLVVGWYPNGDLRSNQGRVVDVQAIRIHPRYDTTSQANDIAVITLASAIDGVRTLTPANAEEAATLAGPGAPARVAGWGATNKQPPWQQSPTYRVGNLVVFPRSSCGGGEPYSIGSVTFRGYKRGDVVRSKMICAAGVRKDKPVDSCVGDSGGPLVAGSGSKRRIIGVVSWGLDECGTTRGAGVYVRVSAYSSWLERAGVPVAPHIPRIARATVTSTSMKITVAPSKAGVAADSYTVSARGPRDKVFTCTVAAPPRPAKASCTIDGLKSGAEYVVHAVAQHRGAKSRPSPERQVTTE